MLLYGKILFIIGVSCGIGWEIVLCVVCDGVNLVIVVKSVELYLKLEGIIFSVVVEVEVVGGQVLLL